MTPTRRTGRGSGATPRAQAQPKAGAADAPTTAHPCDLQMGAYLLAREVTGRRVPTPTRELLLRANESRKEVLQLMPLGRCNVQADLRATGHEGLHRLLAQRRAAGDISSLSESPVVTRARDAALAAGTGAGNCGEFANVAAHVHAARLQDGESISIQKANDRDHSWAAVHGSAPPHGEAACAVIDAWGEGPAIEPADNDFIADAPGPPATEHAIAGADAAQASRVFQQALAEPDRKTARRIALLTQANRNQGRQPSGNVYDPQPIVHSGLCEAARTAIEAHPAPEQLRQRAAALARDIAGVPPAQEQAAAEALIDMAAHLDRPLPRRLAARLPPEPPTED